MVADIQLLQGHVVQDPEKNVKNIGKLIEELALEILSDEDLAIAVSSPVKAQGNS